jgi:hypothetical protein
MAVVWKACRKRWPVVEDVLRLPLSAPQLLFEGVNLLPKLEHLHATCFKSERMDSLIVQFQERLCTLLLHAINACNISTELMAVQHLELLIWKRVVLSLDNLLHRVQAGLRWPHYREMFALNIHKLVDQ